MIFKFKMSISLLAMALVISACSSEDHGYPWKLIEQKQEIKTVDGISLKIKNETNSGLNYEIRNESKEQLSYGQEVYLEIEVNEKWYRIDESLEWEANLLFLEAGTSAEYSFEWLDVYGELPKGHYRLIKTANLLEETIYLADEFYVK